MSVYTVRPSRKNRATDVDRTVEMDAIGSSNDDAGEPRIPTWDEVITPVGETVGGKEGISNPTVGTQTVGGDIQHGPEFTLGPLSIDELKPVEEDLSRLDEDGNPLPTPAAPTKRVARHANPKRPPLRFKNLPKDDPKTKGNSSGSRSHLAGWGRMKNLFGSHPTPGSPVQPHLDPNLDPLVRSALARQYAERMTDLMAAGTMLLGVLFVFVGAWIVFGFGVGLLSAGGILLFLGFWTSMDNHRRASGPSVTGAAQVRPVP